MAPALNWGVALSGYPLFHLLTIFLLHHSWTPAVFTCHWFLTGIHIFLVYSCYGCSWKKPWKVATLKVEGPSFLSPTMIMWSNGVKSFVHITWQPQLHYLFKYYITYVFYQSIYHVHIYFLLCISTRGCWKVLGLAKRYQNKNLIFGY